MPLPRWLTRRLPAAGEADTSAGAAHPLFDAAFYAATYPHLGLEGDDHDRHYRNHGHFNGYDPNRWFASAWYLARNPDVAAQGLNPLDHYLERGAAEGRDPGPAFSTLLYLALNPDVARAGTNPLLHFIEHGRDEERPAPAPFLLEAFRPSRDAPDPIDPRTLAESLSTVRRMRDWATSTVALGTVSLVATENHGAG